MNRKLALGTAAASTLVAASAAIAVGANFGLLGLDQPAGTGLTLPVANTAPAEAPAAVAPEPAPAPELSAELEPEIVEEIQYIDVPTPVQTVYVEVPVAGPTSPQEGLGRSAAPDPSGPPAPVAPAPTTTTTVSPSTVTTVMPTPAPTTAKPTTTTTAKPTTTTTRQSTTTTTEHEDDERDD